MGRKPSASFSAGVRRRQAAVVCASSHFSAPPWQASHETPSAVKSSFVPRRALRDIAWGAWHFRQAASVVGSASRPSQRRTMLRARGCPRTA